VPEVFLLYPGPTVPEWASQLATFGFAQCTFGDCEAFIHALKAGTPPVAIVDDAALPGFPSTSSPLEDFQTARSRPVPLIMLSNWPDLTSRIHAVRLGCRAYLPKPPDLLSLVEAIEAHSLEVHPIPLRVLVVEDDPLQSKHHATVLKAAGMEVTEVNDPLRVMEPLVDGRPDLILMDVYMPGCTGVELATAIRQQEAFVGIPIVFLSQERLRSLQLEAMRHGGDDFLTKPVDPEHLVSIVATRGQRGRVLRGHMVRDSLTGLLNHSSILDRLESEAARAWRGDEALSFAMLDLDHFKGVNDSFGHAAGDRVLRSLARMLQQRLRKTDLIGRYGGEEFAIILPGATVATAISILDEIRAGFSALEFVFGEQHVRLTFSAGVADFPRCGAPERLAELADEALYRAKREGRNRVLSA
jgi:diguanylate cyclase (GGDEF)-like protein